MVIAGKHLIVQPVGGHLMTNLAEPRPEDDVTHLATIDSIHDRELTTLRLVRPRTDTVRRAWDYCLDERIRIRSDQIILWISLTLQRVNQANPSAVPFPAILDTVHIDGTSQPGYAGVPLIVVNGASAGATSGLTVALKAMLRRWPPMTRRGSGSSGRREP